MQAKQTRNHTLNGVRRQTQTMSELLDTPHPPILDMPGTQDFLAEEIAPLSVDILIEGETGTGKDVLARDIHRRSRRPGKFVAINCAAVPEHIAESELFGYEAGAFTGAARAKEGKLEVADQGTLYLDEIDSMPLNIQAKLLRALQERGTERLGGSRFYRSDFRVVASTKIALPTLVEQGSFRKDLYYRLNVVKLCLPSLRDARERILPLFGDFLADACKRHSRPSPNTTGRIQKLLMEYPWPGNIRELKNAAERYALGLPPVEEESAGNLLAPTAAPGRQPAFGDRSLSLRERVRAFESELILTTLREHNESVAKASLELQISVNTLYYRIKTLGVRLDAAPAQLPASAELRTNLPADSIAGPMADPRAESARPQEPSSDSSSEAQIGETIAADEVIASDGALALAVAEAAMPDALHQLIKQHFVRTFRRLVDTSVPRAERLIFPEHEFIGALLEAIAEAARQSPLAADGITESTEHWVGAVVDIAREAILEIGTGLRQTTGNFLEDMVNSQTADRYGKIAKRSLDNFRPQIGKTRLLFDELAQIPDLARLGRQHIWRLCIDPIKIDLMQKKGLPIDTNPYIGHLFDAESSYLHNMGRAWLLAMHDIDRQIDVGLIVALRALCTGEEGAAELSAQAVNRTLPKLHRQLPKACEAWAQFGMLPGESITSDGEKELVAFIETVAEEASSVGEVRFSLYTKRGAGGTTYKILKRDEAQVASLTAFIAQWIGEYHAAQTMINTLQGARQADERIRAIVSLCQKLQRLRPFPHGNCRTFGILLLNRLLLQQGEPLTMIDNPNKLDGFSLDEVVELVREGQIRVARFGTR